MKRTYDHFCLSYQIRKHYAVPKLGITQIRRYSSHILESGHGNNPKAIQS